jgi:Ca2+-binding EF-hand superfamily protein
LRSQPADIKNQMIFDKPREDSSHLPPLNKQGFKVNHSLYNNVSPKANLTPQLFTNTISQNFPSNKSLSMRDICEAPSNEITETSKDSQSLSKSTNELVSVMNSGSEKLKELNNLSSISRKEKRLIRVLKEQLDLEEEVESLKRKLINCSDFNLGNIFGIFATQDRKYINSKTLKEAFNYFDVFPNRNDIKLIFKRFDMDNDGLLSYFEFKSMLLPVDQKKLELLVESSSYLNLKEEKYNFSQKIKDILNLLFKKMIDTEFTYELFRERLAEKLVLDIYEAFGILDKDGKGYIGIAEFRELLNKERISVSDSQLYRLFNRYDKDGDGKVSFCDFSAELTPIL